MKSRKSLACRSPQTPKLIPDLAGRTVAVGSAHLPTRASGQQANQSQHNQAKMRTGSHQHPPGRYNGNRPFQQPQRTSQRNQFFDSSGPNIKVRGNAYQIFERYVALAREASTGGDPIAAENLYQHAEHYFRINNAGREVNQEGTPPRPASPADVVMNSSEPSSEVAPESSQTRWDNDDPVSAQTSTP